MARFVHRISFLSALASVLLAGAGAMAQTSSSQSATEAATSAPCTTQSTQDTCETCIVHRPTLTGNWFNLGEQLHQQGFDVLLAVTQIYQQNLGGGLSTHRHAGRYEGSYDLELNVDLEKVLRLQKARLYMLTEGSWSEGIDESSVGSVFGVNADAAGNIPIEVSQLFYEQGFLDDKVQVRVGKLDLTGTLMCRGCPASFDGNSYANDPKTQFLNGALTNNPTIPFPDAGLGAIAYVQPLEWWYLSAGASDARADIRETGFSTAFHESPEFFSIYETGVVPHIPTSRGPLVGAYRAGFWYDPQEKADFRTGRDKRDDVGMYLSFDQMLTRENDNPDDCQGLGAFARYGFADKDVNPVTCFWSVGTQYQGLIPTRDQDVIAVGVAQGKLNEEAGFTRPHETALEMYYNACITPWLSISPDVQYIFNPGGDRTVSDAVVIGVRIQMTF